MKLEGLNINTVSRAVAVYLDLAYGEVRATMQFLGGKSPGENATHTADHRHTLHEVNTSSLAPDLEDSSEMCQLMDHTGKFIVIKVPVSMGKHTV